MPLSWLIVVLGCIIGGIFTLPCLAIMNNWSSAGEEFIIPLGQLGQKIAPRWILRKTLSTLIIHSWFDEYDMFKYLLFARMNGFKELEQTGWNRLKKCKHDYYQDSLVNILEDEELLMLHKKAMEELETAPNNGNAFSRILANDHIKMYHDWAWRNFKAKPDAMILAYIVERRQLQSSEAWEILLTLDDRHWALYHLIHSLNEDQLRFKAWRQVMPWIQNQLIEAKSKKESGPNTNISWSGINETVKMKEALCRLSKYKGISEEAWLIASHY